MTDDSKATREQRVVFGMAPDAPPSSGLTLFLGLSAQCREFISDGKTNTLDLTRLGLPIRVVIYGGDTVDACRKIVEDANAARGLATLDLQREDFAIKAPVADKT